jgi:hypothetical protein
MKSDREHRNQSALDPILPTPSSRSRWRWSTTRRALAGGGALAAALSFGTVAAGASAPRTGQPTRPSAQHGTPSAGRGQPTTGGKVTSLSDDVITLQDRDRTSQTVTYSSTTTFRTMTGSTTATALKVGEFIMVVGTKNTDGSVTAKSITVGTGPPGNVGDHPGGNRPSPKGDPPMGKEGG